MLDFLLKQGISVLKLKIAVIIRITYVESRVQRTVDKQRVRGKAIWFPWTIPFWIRKDSRDIWKRVCGLQKWRQVAVLPFCSSGFSANHMLLNSLVIRTTFFSHPFQISYFFFEPLFDL